MQIFAHFLASLSLRREKMIKTFGLKGIIKKKTGDDQAQTDLVTSSDPETLILAAFAFESSNTGSYADLVKQIGKIFQEEKTSNVPNDFGRQNFFPGF